MTLSWLADFFVARIWGPTVRCDRPTGSPSTRPLKPRFHYADFPETSPSFVAGPDLRGARAPGPPPNPSHFIFGSIDTHNSCVYTTYASMTPRIIFFPYFNTGCMYYHCTVWVKNPPPWNFLTFFSQTAGNFSPNFYMPIIHSYLRWTTNFYSITCNFDEVLMPY